MRNDDMAKAAVLSCTSVAALAALRAAKYAKEMQTLLQVSQVVTR